MDDRERRVRDEAYRLWDEAGRPDGEGEKHWYEAEKRVAAGPAAPASAAAAARITAGKRAGDGGFAPAVANDRPKDKAMKGAAVDVAAAKPKKAKTETAAAGAQAKPAKDAKPNGRPKAKS